MINCNDLQYGDIVVVRCNDNTIEVGTVRGVSQLNGSPIVDYTIGSERNRWAYVDKVIQHTKVS